MLHLLLASPQTPEQYCFSAVLAHALELLLTLGIAQMVLVLWSTCTKGADSSRCDKVGVVQAAAAAAERRARDDAGCACGAKGGTSFTEAEVIELESQPGSAAAQQALGTEEPGVQQPAHAEQSRAGASSMQGQSCVALEATPQQQGELLYGRKHQQTAVNGKRKQSREAADMRELIDLTADSDDDVTD